ncbi:hypothetical protein C7C46_18775 [Streptomyces tateyamensis]|uniref:Uncharacterized protein n=1 Tax=Streptomyces tateyamensis TaxID=565073 RepID=A0A2V4NBL7_9ACTN|nr:hypothetical protein [Streptomyces tateyamensis]PYC77447.1 hypothetical protein C7C46_18775 [Streptomyces tateyamensis]
MSQPVQNENITDERLCWLVAREQVGRLARKPGAFGWFTIVLGWLSALYRFGNRTGTQESGRGMRQERTSQRMADYALAVDDTAERLSAEERRQLRASRELPAWFMPEVERRFAAIRKAG